MRHANISCCIIYAARCAIFRHNHYFVLLRLISAMLRTFLFILLSCAFTVAVANDQRVQTKQQIAQAAKDIAELKKQLSKIAQEKSALNKH